MSPFNLFLPHHRPFSWYGCWHRIDCASGGLGTREVLIHVFELWVEVSGALDTRRDLDRSDLRRHSTGVDSVTLSYGTDLLQRPCKSRVKINNSLPKAS